MKTILALLFASLLSMSAATSTNYLATAPNTNSSIFLADTNVVLMGSGIYTWTVPYGWFRSNFSTVSNGVFSTLVANDTTTSNALRTLLIANDTTTSNGVRTAMAAYTLAVSNLWFTGSNAIFVAAQAGDSNLLALISASAFGAVSITNGLAVGNGGAVLTNIIYTVASVNFASVANGASDAQTVSMPGVKQGDVVTIGIPTDGSGYVIKAQSLLDNVILRIVNVNAGTIDLNAMNIGIEVKQYR